MRECWHRSSDYHSLTGESSGPHQGLDISFLLVREKQRRLRPSALFRMSITSCRFSCKSRAKPGPWQNHKAKHFCFHNFFTLPFPSSQGATPAAPAAHTPDPCSPQSQYVETAPCMVQTSLLLTPKFTESEPCLSCLPLSKLPLGNQSR